MADQGSGGAFEISQRMTAMVGWGATSGFQEVRGVGTVQQAARAGLPVERGREAGAAAHLQLKAPPLPSL